jgi:hypothetical protein
MKWNYNPAAWKAADFFGCYYWHTINLVTFKNQSDIKGVSLEKDAYESRMQQK